jgi:hypothetical protein
MNLWAWLIVRRIVRVSRVFCYAIVICLIGGLAASSVVYARLTEGSLRTGRELELLNDLLGSTKTVFINGTSIHVSTAFTDQTPGEVLDRFEALCREHPQFMVRALADIPATLLGKTKVARDQLWRIGVIRKQERDDGVLTCFTDDVPTSVGNLMDRMQAFGRSGDLAEFGHFRYVYVRRIDKVTHVRTIWTNGEFNLHKMFPADGDAVGFDSDAVPRPPNATRLFTATSAEVPFSARIYRASGSAEGLRPFYDRAMNATGWTRVSLDGRPDELAYTKDAQLCFVALTPAGTTTLVATTETTRGDGGPAR